MGIQSVSQPANGVPLAGAATPQSSTAVAAQAAAPIAQAVATQAQQPQEQSASLEQALKQIEVAVQAQANNLQFSVDDSTGKTVVRVVDGDNGSTIRQIPSEEALAIAHDIERMRGLLLRDSA